jgi:hypothetical protein
MKLLPLFVISLATLAAASCSPGGETKTASRSVLPPWENVRLPEQTFSFDATAGDTFELSNGTVIRIPGGILLDLSGKHVTGNVDLSFREIYTAAEIIASGIPMDYDSAGANYCFQSAGMFDLNATQNNEPLTIESGKSISMDFATTRNDQTYSFYRYDTIRNAWSFQDIPEVDSNETRKVSEEEVLASAAQEPIKPIEYTAKDPVIDLDFDLEKHPELSGYNGIIWQYAGSGADPEVNKWIYAEQWQNASLQLSNREAGIYALRLTNAEKNFSTFIRPVLKGDDYKKALAEFTTRMSAFEAQEKERRAEAEKVKTIPAFVSRINVLAFGIHNLDCLRHSPEFIFANVNFRFDDAAFNADKGGITVYIVSGKEEMTVGYNALTTTGCYYKRNSGNKVIAVHHDSGKAWVMNSKAFSAAAGSGTTNLTVTMKPSPDQVNDMAALESLLDKL